MFDLLLQPTLKVAKQMAAEGTGIFKPLYWVFGKFMELLLSVMNNEYFVAIIVFTVITRLVLLPLNIHQQKKHCQKRKIAAENSKNSKKNTLTLKTE